MACATAAAENTKIDPEKNRAARFSHSLVEIAGKDLVEIKRSRVPNKSDIEPLE